VTLQIGTFTITIPPGSFVKAGPGYFTFEGVVERRKAYEKPSERRTPSDACGKRPGNNFPFSGLTSLLVLITMSGDMFV
jgi:hypothetical protein